MPTYVYRCPDGHEFEAFHKMSEDGPDRCEVCEKEPVERVLFPVAVHFKGSGFYATDYGRGNRKRDGGKDDSGTGTGSGESGSSSDSSSGNGSASEKSSDGGSGSGSSSSESSSSGGASEKKTAEA